MKSRLLLVFFVSKRQLVKIIKKKFKKSSKRGQTRESTWLVVAVDERGQENEPI